MSTLAIPVHVPLVEGDEQIDPAELARVAGALNEQVTADFAPVWGVAATVGVYLIPPLATWRVELRNGIDVKDAGGYHWSDHNQPYAKVDLTAGDWTVTTSHEVL